MTPLVDVSTPEEYAEPPPCVPSAVVENLNGCAVGCSNLYVRPTFKTNDFL